MLRGSAGVRAPPERPLRRPLRRSPGASEAEVRQQPRKVSPGRARTRRAVTWPPPPPWWQQPRSRAWRRERPTQQPQSRAWTRERPTPGRQPGARPRGAGKLPRSRHRPPARSVAVRAVRRTWCRAQCRPLHRGGHRARSEHAWPGRNHATRDARRDAYPDASAATRAGPWPRARADPQAQPRVKAEQRAVRPVRTDQRTGACPDPRRRYRDPAGQRHGRQRHGARRWHGQQRTGSRWTGRRWADRQRHQQRAGRRRHRQRTGRGRRHGRRWREAIGSS